MRKGGLTNVLEAGEVLAVGRVLGDSGGKEVPAGAAPGGALEVGARITDAFLVDLEPVAGPVVGLDVVVRGAGEVDKAGAYVRQVQG